MLLPKDVILKNKDTILILWEVSKAFRKQTTMLSSTKVFTHFGEALNYNTAV